MAKRIVAPYQPWVKYRICGVRFWGHAHFVMLNLSHLSATATLPVLPVIAISDNNDWEDQLIASLKLRARFVLRDLDVIRIGEPKVIKDICDWCVNSKYTPKLVNLTDIEFNPNAERKAMN